MNMKKRMCMVAGIIALSACLMVGASACNKGSTTSASTATPPTLSGSVTSGTLSDSYYTSKEEAAQYCIEHEVLNDTGEGTYLFYSKTEDLTEADMAAIPVGTQERAYFVAAEKGLAHYSKKSQLPIEQMSLILTNTTNISDPSQEIYILEFTSDGETTPSDETSVHYYKYFIPDE